MKTPSIMKNNLIWQKWVGNKRKTIFNSVFFSTDSKAAASKLQCCSADLCASSSFFGGSKWPGKKNQSSSSKKKNILHFLIHLPLISTKEIFCTAGREVGCLCFGFLFKMGDSDNLSSGEAPEKPIKNSDIFFILFTEEGRNHYYSRKKISWHT